MILDTNALSALADGHARDYEDWLNENLPLCQVLETTEETTGFYADVRLELKRAGRPIPPNDPKTARIADP